LKLDNVATPVSAVPIPNPAEPPALTKALEALVSVPPPSSVTVVSVEPSSSVGSRDNPFGPHPSTPMPTAKARTHLCEDNSKDFSSFLIPHTPMAKDVTALKCGIKPAARVR
jgi:hypothetical protein